MTSGWCWAHIGESCLLSPELRHCVGTEMVIPLLQATFISHLDTWNNLSLDSPPGPANGAKCSQDDLYKMQMGMTLPYLKRLPIAQSIFVLPSFTSPASPPFLSLSQLHSLFWLVGYDPVP